ncbi:SRPBCC family protein [Amycolatopsis sp. H20-H5]|uniref:SRPBCC family protein n=1 Tax=Amycolatopsis sp. H20-H5 TaxID=3046309 RepID=UPI002DBF71E2|nr:SRPBCC family protein [Amycolatopsis sp. H20-H5]MEC3981645.1 SRPBCC family protein [Amycolatopsis sp. H20-H5]
MVDVERTFTVPKPVETVVEYLKDFARTESWDPGTVSCDRLDEGPVKVGSTWRNVSEFRGKKTELAYELTRLEPGRLTFVGKNKTATSTDDLRFTAVGEGTSITYHAHIVFNGLAKLADPFLKREFEKLGDEVAVMMPDAFKAVD